MSFSRRALLQGAASLASGTTILVPRGASAAITSGKPFAGQSLKVMTVTASQFTAQSKRLPQFTAQTGIIVTYEDVNYFALRERLTAEMVASSGDYDVVCVLDQWAPSLRDFLEPIDSQARLRNIDLTDYPKPFLDAGIIDGKLYGFPLRAHMQLLFYRKDIFTELGLEAPKTWEEVISVSNVIQQKKDLPGIAMYYKKMAGQSQEVWYDFLWGAGGDLFDTTGKVAFDSPTGIKATQDYVDMMLKHHVTTPGAASFGEGDAVTSFIQGRVAMLPVWWWVVTRFGSSSSVLKSEQVGFVPLPSYPGKPATSATTTFIYAINRNSKNKDAAMEFLDWAARAELERDILLDPNEHDVVATHFSTMNDTAVNARFDGLHKLAAEVLRSQTRSVHFFPQFPQMTDILDTAISSIAIGQESVEGAMTRAASQTTRLMRQAR
jgi:multiple sugar transport system substrate-binding protein